MKIIRIIKTTIGCEYESYLSRLGLMLSKKEDSDHDFIIHFSDGKKIAVCEFHFREYKRQLPNMEARFMLNYENEGLIRRINYHAFKAKSMTEDPINQVKVETNNPDKLQILFEIDFHEKKCSSLWKFYHWNKWTIQDQDEEEILVSIESIYLSASRRIFLKSEIGILPIGTEQKIFD